eukprot:2718563-Rhodomonas_salina.2
MPVHAVRFPVLTPGGYYCVMPTPVLAAESNGLLMRVAYAGAMGPLASGITLPICPTPFLRAVRCDGVLYSGLELDLCGYHPTYVLRITLPMFFASTYVLRIILPCPWLSACFPARCMSILHPFSHACFLVSYTLCPWSYISHLRPLCIRYAVSGTDLAGGPAAENAEGRTHAWAVMVFRTGTAGLLRVCYAMSGTEIACATRLRSRVLCDVRY